MLWFVGRTQGQPGLCPTACSECFSSKLLIVLPWESLSFLCRFRSGSSCRVGFPKESAVLTCWSQGEHPPWVGSDPVRGRPAEAKAMGRVLSPSLSRADLWIVSLWSVNHLSPGFIVTTNCAVVLTIWFAEPRFWPVVLHGLHWCACVCNHAFFSLCPLTSGLCAPCSLPASWVLWSRSLCCESVWDTFITLLCTRAKSLQSCLTLRPYGACQAPLSVGFSRQEYWSRLPFPPPGHNTLGCFLTSLSDFTS